MLRGADVAWVDLKQQLQNMIISYSDDAAERVPDLIPNQVFVHWPLTAEVGAVKISAPVSGEIAKTILRILADASCCEQKWSSDPTRSLDNEVDFTKAAL